MKYKNITLKKYQIIKHIINKYAESHNNVTPNINYDKDNKILEISGISKPINFHTDSIGIIPKGAYEVVGQVIRSKTSKGQVDKDGMNMYDSAQRIFNIANDNRQEVFDFIDANSKSSYCSCCGTNRDRNKLFYIRKIDTSDKMYQVGSSCITEYFDTSYFDLMKEISGMVEYDNTKLIGKFTDYNLIDYLALYCMFIKAGDNATLCNKKVIEVLDSCSDVSETQWASEFLSQKVANDNMISTIAKFYTAYPNYAQENNVFAIKTMQSMNEVLNNNLDIDPYYSKTNCANIAKMYISLLQDYTRDYKKYQIDLFKYNAYLVETTLSDIWEEYNHTQYKLRFDLNKQIFNVSIANASSATLRKVTITVNLDAEGNMVDAKRSKSELIDLASKVNGVVTSSVSKKKVITDLTAYKDECMTRYKNYKPVIMLNCNEMAIKVFDYANEPLVIDINAITDTEDAKLKLSNFINMSYNRQKLNLAYKDFSKKYLGNMVMAYTQSKELNLQFSCDYAEKQFLSNWPKDKSLITVSSYVDTSGKNVVIQYSRSSSSMKFPVNNIGIISGADYDIEIRIKTFIAKELGQPLNFYKKLREVKSAEDIVKSRPKKNVTRIFNAAGVSVKNLVTIPQVNILNDLNSKTIGLTVPKIGKILFNVENNNIVEENSMYCGRIVLDGHTVSTHKMFDKKTLSNAVHSLEYLIYLSDENNNLMVNREVTNSKTGVNYTYKHTLKCGTGIGILQFRIAQSGDSCNLKYGPKFIMDKIVDGDHILCMVNLNFSEDCWKNIQNGILTLNDIQRNTSVLHGQKNNHMIFGTMWINGADPQKLSNGIFTKLTGINI